MLGELQLSPHQVYHGAGGKVHLVLADVKCPGIFRPWECIFKHGILGRVKQVVMDSGLANLNTNINTMA